MIPKNRIKFLFFNIFLIAIFFPSMASSEIFCVQSQNDLINALDVASGNNENDILHIVEGAELDNFTLPSEVGHLIQLKGSYSSNCVDRTNAPKTVSQLNQPMSPQKSSTMPQQNTTGPIPPKEVLAKTEIVSGAALSGGVDITVLGVPGYAWRHGCGPTAVGMVVGFWDETGCSDLFDGGSSTQTSSVDQGIASEGSSSNPLHYEDYSLPLDSYPNMSLDKSELPAGDEHISDSIADFMYTSWSSSNNYYGWSWSNHIEQSFSNYAQLRNSSYVPSTQTYYYGSTLTWGVLTSEIDAQRPMVFLVDSSGSGSTDHFVTVVGYRLDGTTQYYGCLDTWSPYDTIRWVRFRGLSSGYSWGVWGGYSFQLTCTNDTPDFTPNDLTGDGTADVLIRNSNFGVLYMIKMDSGTADFESVSALDKTAWNVAGLGDLTSDGTADVLIRHNTFGVLYMIEMDGAIPIISSVTGLDKATWDVEGIADLTGDGTDDILIRHTTAGVLYMVKMDSGSTVIAPVTALDKTTWSVEGMGDLTGDGTADILIRNNTFGVLFMVKMDSGTATFESVSALDKTAWGVAGVGDLTGDGTADILIRHTTFGTLYMINMDGATPAIASVTGLDKTTWDVENVSDLTGDGKEDILIRHTTAGVLYMVKMDSGTAVIAPVTALDKATWNVMP